MDPIGITVAVIAVVAASSFALFRRHTDGRFRTLDLAQQNGGSVGDNADTVKPKFVQFSGEYCAQCKRNRAIFERLKSKRGDFDFEEINVEDQPDLVQELKIRRTPTVFLLNGRGERVFRTEGAVSLRSANDIADKLIGESA